MRRLVEIEKRFVPLAETENEKMLARMVSDAITFLIRCEHFKEATEAMNALSFEVGARTFHRTLGVNNRAIAAERKAANG